MEYFLDFLHPRHARAGKSQLQLVMGQRLLAEQKLNIQQIVLISTSHFSQDEVYRRGPKNGQLLQAHVEWLTTAATSPVAG